MTLLTRYIIVSILIVQQLLELSKLRFVPCRKDEKKTISKALDSASTKLSRMIKNKLFVITLNDLIRLTCVPNSE